MNVQSFTVVLLYERQSIIQHEIPLNKEFVFQIVNILSFLNAISPQDLRPYTHILFFKKYCLVC